MCTLCASMRCPASVVSSVSDDPARMGRYGPHYRTTIRPASVVSSVSDDPAGMGRYGPHYRTTIRPASVVSSVSDDRDGDGPIRPTLQKTTNATERPEVSTTIWRTGISDLQDRFGPIFLSRYFCRNSSSPPRRPTLRKPWKQSIALAGTLRNDVLSPTACQHSYTPIRAARLPGKTVEHPGGS